VTARPDRDAWLEASPPQLRPALAACASGALPANVALLRLLIEAGDGDEVEAALAEACEGARLQPGSPQAAERLQRALSLWRENPQAFATVKAVLGGVEHGGTAPSLDQGVAAWTRTFDRMAEASPEGSVALYALGNPDLLRTATEEVVARMREWGLLGRSRAALEIGCGIGRFAAALAPECGSILGLDISDAMLARARERCAGLRNVTLARSSGRDLAPVADSTIDLVLAADVFPYLVQTGAELADRHVAEAARVLKPGGHLLILNYSYRGDPEQDRREVAQLAARHAFEIRRAAAQDFSLWDAATFLLRR
jgi:SAM-dependent methyltransferase